MGPEGSQEPRTKGGAPRRRVGRGKGGAREGASGEGKKGTEIWQRGGASRLQQKAQSPCFRTRVEGVRYGREVGKGGRGVVGGERGIVADEGVGNLGRGGSERAKERFHL